MIQSEPFLTFLNVLKLETGLGMSMAKGELSLIVVKTGYDSGIIASTSFLLPLVGVITMITTFITPYVIKFGKQLGGN